MPLNSLRNAGYVALKILISNIPGSTTELQILHRINTTAPEKAAHYITRLLDEFDLHGANGFHKCLVFELTRFPW